MGKRMLANCSQSPSTPVFLASNTIYNARLMVEFIWFLYVHVLVPQQCYQLVWGLQIKINLLPGLHLRHFCFQQFSDKNSFYLILTMYLCLILKRNFHPQNLFNAFLYFLWRVIDWQKAWKGPALSTPHIVYGSLLFAGVIQYLIVCFHLDSFHDMQQVVFHSCSTIYCYGLGCYTSILSPCVECSYLITHSFKWRTAESGKSLL